MKAAARGGVSRQPRGVPNIETFARGFYAEVGREDLERRGAENLTGAARAMLDFAAMRRLGQPKLRIYDPDPKRDGWASSGTVVEIVNDDMPFLVDSIAGLLDTRGISIRLIVHPVFFLRRNSAGGLLEVLDAKSATKPKGGRAESLMQIEIDPQEPGARGEIERAIAQVLRDVRATVRDWRAMREKIGDIIAEIRAVRPPVPAAEIAESIAFLEWLREDHFTFQGIRSYRLTKRGGREYLRPEAKSGLGLLRTISPDAAARHRVSLPPALAAFTHRRGLLIVARATTRTLVHRAVPLDFVGVRRFSTDGKVIGQYRIVGLLTSSAYNQSPRSVPLLRNKIARVLTRAGFAPDSHNGKAFLHILETYPRDELFQASEGELLAAAMGILQLQDRRRVALFLRRDPLGWHVSCLVFVPRERYSDEIKQRFQAILEEAFSGTDSTCDIRVSDAPLTRLHFVVRLGRRAAAETDVKAIERRLADAARSWSERLAHPLADAFGEAKAAGLMARYAGAFSPAYQHRFGAHSAILDIARVEAVLDSGRMGVYLSRPSGAPAREIRLKLYHPRAPIALSEILPILEHMGFHVATELPFEVKPKGAPRPVWIQDVAMETVEKIDCAVLEPRFRDCFLGVFEGTIEDDGFNALILESGLTWREAMVLRAYARYLRQSGMPWSGAYVQNTLRRNPVVAALLIRSFAAKFDPDSNLPRAEMDIIATKLAKALDAVSNPDEDRILRRFHNLILATVRTNYFQTDNAGTPKPHLALKFDSRRIDELPLPKPLYEIFVYSAEMEGVHLRGGKIARGGIRWSDRREDFRTEILGLMKAQMVKNAVIVPVGAKGGFVLKRPPASAAELPEKGLAGYRVLIRGMLDVTDNLVRGKVVPPARVVRHDGDDTYLVVAADKGTAKFSDAANAIAAEYGFWLDDAFASGGSHGYDHKTMGITARGAWESVKRHFREMGRDAGRDAITVVGVGDMSGDVFGNGMLMSRRIELIGAFDHRHIFIDPDPDPRAAFAERARLFKMPRSSWADYRAGAISTGGGVFDRRLRAIPATRQMRAALDLAGDSVTPNALIRALLCAKVDLIWFGGIGTFVRAGHEPDIEVGDRANDAIRVKGRDLRARVVAEGANLAMTQRARIEYAMRGGRVNTDFIDNSAGVDCSDHEVNIKILLNILSARGKLSRDERDALLAAAQSETADLVLRDNYLQTQTISIHESRAPYLIDLHQRLMRSLERQVQLDRVLEFLPDDEEIAQRARLKRGLTRPEIAVLVAYGKMALYQELSQSDLPDDPHFAADLKNYFPSVVASRSGKALLAHPLKREIVVTMMANSLVNRMSASFVNEVKENTGAGAADIARAYAVVRDVFALRDIWAGIKALDGAVAARVQIEMMVGVRALIERAVSWLLSHAPAPLDVGALSAAFRPGVRYIARHIESLLAVGKAARLEARIVELTAEDVPQPLARAVVALPAMASALDIVAIANASGIDVRHAARIYFAVGTQLRMAALRDVAAGLPAESPWQRQAVAALVQDLFGEQAEIAQRIACAAKGRRGADAAVGEWARKSAPAIARAQRIIADVMAAPAPDLSMIAVANQALRALAQN